MQLAGRWLVATGVVLALGGCAVIEKASEEEAVKQVSERAQERWNLVMKGQMEKAYEYLSPASRSTLSFDAFRRHHAPGRRWRAIQLEKVDCRPDACQVRMTLEYDLFEIKGLKRSLEETWIKDAGTWWLVAGT